MKKLFVLALFGLFLAGCADKPLYVLTADNGATTIAVYDKKCSNKEVLAKIEYEAMMAKGAGVPTDIVDNLVKKFKDAEVAMGDKHSKACVVDRGDDYYVIDENGSEGSLPKK